MGAFGKLYADKCVAYLYRLDLLTIDLNSPARLPADSGEHYAVSVGGDGSLDVIFAEIGDVQGVFSQGAYGFLELVLVKIIEELVLEKHFLFVLGNGNDKGYFFVFLKSAKGLDHHVSALEIIVKEIFVEPEIYLALIVGGEIHIYHILGGSLDDELDVGVFALNDRGVFYVCAVA